MTRGLIVLACAGFVVLMLVLLGSDRRSDAVAAADGAPSAPVLSVALIRPQTAPLPVRVAATGHVAAWQEASVGTEADGLRLTELRVNVGDTVTRGQVLALFDADLIEADLAEARAAVAQADAEAAEAAVNDRRAQGLGAIGAMSAQQVGQYAAGAATARASLDAARAVERRHRLRLTHARVLAPSDGVITARTATVGAVAAAGQELFRLIRDGRLEWRASVSAADLHDLQPGQSVTIDMLGRDPVHGTLRMLAPMIDVATHTGLAYVDLPLDSALRAGTFVTGSIEVGERPALTLPQSAVLLRDGFHTVMRVGVDSSVIAAKVEVGRRVGDRIEITAGLVASEAVIASGLGFLSEGDVVRVVGDADQIAPGADTPGRTDANVNGSHAKQSHAPEAGAAEAAITGSHAAAAATTVEPHTTGSQRTEFRPDELPRTRSQRFESHPARSHEPPPAHAEPVRGGT